MNRLTRSVLAAAAVIGALFLVADAKGAEATYSGPYAPPTVRVAVGPNSGGSAVHIGDGKFVTATHVIEGEDDIDIVYVLGGTEIKSPATVVTFDKETDVAVLKVEKYGAVEVAPVNCELPKVGETVRAVGSPFGIYNLTTFGRVARLPGTYPTIPKIEAANFGQYIMFDLTLAPGNSGGPIFNEAGQVIAISDAILSVQGTDYPISMGVPSTEVCRLANIS